MRVQALVCTIGLGALGLHIGFCVRKIMHQLKYLFYNEGIGIDLYGLDFG